MLDAPPASLGLAFETVALRFPNELAVRSQRFRLTYADLLQATRRVAAAITRAGAANGHVAVLAEHDAPGIAGVYGTFATGAVCVPLDPAWPAARIGAILQDAEVRTVLADAANA